MKVLRASVIRSSEWRKERNPDEWKRTRQLVLVRDGYTCAYCLLTCKQFMQVNHIGPEDDHSLNNLETICAACHSVLHLGASAMAGVLTVFECKPEVINMAAITCVTRSLVAKRTHWEQIEGKILEQFGCPGGRVYGDVETIACANRMLKSIKQGEFRGYLPEGLAAMFHMAGEWNGWPEATWKWQVLPESRYAKAR